MVVIGKLSGTIGIVAAAVILAGCGGSVAPASPAPAPASPSVAVSSAGAKPAASRREQFEAADKVPKPAAVSKPSPAVAANASLPAATNRGSQGSATLIPSPDGMTVYDTANNVSWLADANLATSNQFGLPLCAGSGNQTCVNASGSMPYDAAAAWVSAMNAAHFLGRADWRLPTTPSRDSSCAKTGTNDNSFGFNCVGSAMGSLYHKALGLTAPNTAVPIPNNTVGPFGNFQPYLYWSQTPGGATAEACKSAPNGCGMASFSFNSGFHGANTLPNFLYVLPSIPGKLAGTPPASGTALEVNPGGQTVYDPVADRTWLADAGLAISNTFGLPRCTDPTTPPVCVAQDGAMTFTAASQLIANLNTAAYLGQNKWEIPPQDATCPAYKCGGSKDPMGNLYEQLGLSKGQPVVAAPDIPVGPFHHLQPYLYWACQGEAIQAVCAPNGPVPNQEWSFSFGSGFTGTDILPNDLYATAYFPGPTTPAGPKI